MAIEDPLEDFREKLQKELPKAAQVTQIEFEGPEIAIYAQKPRAFGDQSSIKELAKRFRKRIVIRSDPLVRKPHDLSEEEIRKIVPEEAEITGITFNETIGEVIIEAKKPGLVIGRTGTTLEEIRLKTLWRPTVIRTPPLKSDTILKVRHAIQNSSEDRKAYLRTIGRRIHRPALMPTSYIRLTPLGGFREVGRMAILIQTPESKVLIDCGVNVGATDQAFPRFDLPEFDLNTLDAVVITHSHLDHCLPPETPIKMATGQWKAIGDIKPGEFVTSYNWEIGDFEPAKCVGKTITHGHTERIEIKTPYHSISSSPNHRFFIYGGLELREIEAQDLQRNMLLPIQRPDSHESSVAIPLQTQIPFGGRFPLTDEMRRELRHHRTKKHLTQKDLAQVVGVHQNAISKIETKQKFVTFPVLKSLIEFFGIDWNSFAKEHGLPKLPTTLTPKLAQIVGYLQGDGHKSSEHSFRMTEVDQSTINTYCSLFHDVFGITPKIHPRSGTDKLTFSIDVNNAYILRFLETNFLSVFAKSRDLYIPNILHNAPNRIKQAYLRGIFDAEGTVVNAIRFCSYSSRLRREVQFLLYQLGIPANHAPTEHTVTIASAQAILQYTQLVGLSSETKTQKLQQLCKTKDKTYSVQHFELVPISSADLAQILECAGILGRVHHSPRITDLPFAILDWYRRKSGYATRTTVEQLIEVLLVRQNDLDTLKASVHDDLLAARRALSLPRADVAEATGMSMMQVQYREEGNLQDELTTKLEAFILSQIERTQDQIRVMVQKINHILSLDIDWYPIKELRRVPNEEPLIDIEVLPNRSFVAKGIVVHNCGFTPFLYKYGYEGPVYCTSPTQDLMTMLQVDYLEVAQREGKLAPYGLKDVRKLIMHTIPLNYGEVTDIAPDVRLTLHNAGHILGSSIAHLHIGDGLYNLAYTGDFKYARSRLLEPATDRFPRLETLIMESTYGAPQDLMPTRKNSERQLVEYINRTLERGGKVLIPVLAVGRAQELLVVIDEYMNRGTLLEAPVFVDGMIIEATAIHTAHPEYLARELRDKIFHQGQNPFLAEYFTQVDGHKVRDEILETGPCIILATSGMLTGGPSVEYFKQLAGNPDNSIIFVSYQVEGTLGRRIQKGRRQLPFRNAGDRRQVVKVELQIHTVEGFSGHSDRRQLMDYVRRIQPKPERVLTCHGEASKCINLASSLHRALAQRRRLETRAIQNFETVRLY
jgi:predicted metal-dependent RNase/predicted transcriptional regulator